MIPRWFYPIGMLTLCIAVLPFALVAKSRASRSDTTRPMIIWNMDFSESYLPQSANPMFADGRSMRPDVPGTIARGELEEDDHLYRGQVDGEWATTFPPALNVDRQFLDRGKERYEIFCLPCHGGSGKGNGPVSIRADELQEGTWTPPTDYHTDVLRQMPVGSLYNSITNGVRNMPAYGTQVSPRDRWAIVAYIRALQKSQYATLDDVPAEGREELR